jgi:D-alanyl-D-alanine carboxypeptidase
MQGSSDRDDAAMPFARCYVTALPTAAADQGFGSVFRLLPGVLNSVPLGLWFALATVLPAQSALPPPVKSKVSPAERIDILKQSYPDLIFSVTRNSLRLMSNRFITIDDHNEKNHLDKMRNGDVEDQLSEIYPVGSCYKGRRHHFDPGLIRHMPFFRAAYGSTEHYVKRETQTFDWFGTPIRISKRHGAARALSRVLAELRKLPRKFHDVLKSPRRALDWTPIINTDEITVHAFAIAIDLNPAFSDNWRRFGRRIKNIHRYRNRIHPEVVAIFERHGFIWGGKWQRFETGHFEYRPELIAIGKLAKERGCEKY